MASEQDTYFMESALEEACKARDLGEVPVGAVVVKNGQIIGRGHNRMIFDKNPTAHAEMIALREAAESVGNYRILGAELYVTLEPCAMCAYASVLARIDRIVYGAADPKTGALRSLFQLVDDPRLNHQIEVAGGVLEEACGEILVDFFKSRR